MMRSLCFILLSSLTSITIAQDQVAAGYGFMPNRGQLHDQQGRPVEGVQYFWPGKKGMNVQIRDGAIAYDTYRKDRAQGVHQMRRLDLRFIGADTDPVFAEELEQELRSNFYLAHCREGILDVPYFHRIVQKDILPRIDLVHMVTDDWVYKYDLLVHEGGDPSQIQIEYTGFDRAEIHGDSIIFHFNDRSITETIPASWRSNGSPIGMAYRVIEETPGRVVVGFTSEDVMGNGGLVIDPRPYLEWASYFGHDGDDAGTAIATDTIGIMYVAGRTDALITLATDNAHQSEYGGGGSDAFLMRMASWGSRIWCTYFGGTGDDEATGVDVHQEHIVHVSGITDSDLPGTDSTFQASPGGGKDAFVARFDMNGALVWCSYIGGPADDRSTDCVSDGNGGVFVSGSSTDPDLFAASSVQPSIAHAGGIDGFIAHFGGLGDLQGCTYFGGNGDDEISAIDRDHTGLVAIAGSTTSDASIATSGAHQEQYGGSTDGFITLFDTTFIAPVWSSYFGGDNADAATSIVITDSTVIVGGHTGSAGLITDSAAYQTSIGGGTDGYVTRFSIDGELQWNTYFGGSQDDSVSDVELDQHGAIYLMGTTASDSLATDSTFQIGLAGGTDVFFAKFEQDSLTWSSYFGGTQDDHAAAFAVYGVTVVHITGHTSSDDLPIHAASEPGLQMNSGGATDAFLTRFVQIESTPCVSVDCSGGGGGGSQPWNNGGQGGGGGEITCGIYGDAIAICFGETITLSVVGGALGWGSYWMWYTNSCGDPAQFLAMGPQVTFIPDQSMSVFVRAENAFSYTACKEFQIIVDLPVTAVATGPESVCAGEPIELSVSGGVCHYWSGPQGFEAFTADTIAVSDGLSGLHEFIGWAISQHAACTDQDTVTVMIHEPPVVQWVVHDPICIDGTGSISADSISMNYLTFEWPALGSSASSIEDLPPGGYTVMITDTIGCSTTDTLQIVQPMALVDSLVIEHASCGEDNGRLSVIFDGVEEEFDFAWSIGNGSGAVLDSLAPGMYSVEITDPLGCTHQFSATIIDTGPIEVSILADTTSVIPGGPVTLHAMVTPADSSASYSWSPAEMLDDPTAATVIATPLVSVEISVTATSTFGCVDTASVIVHVVLPDPIEPPAAGCPELFIPTIFSPNADGVNDRLHVHGGCIAEMEFRIYDRSSRELFVSDRLTTGWDGSFQGAPVPAGTFHYRFTAQLNDGRMVDRSGVFILVR